MQYSRVRATGVRSGPGGAAVVVVVAGDLLICANSGDARAVISRAGTAVPLSDDHKPDRSDEQERIIKAGGWVRNRRVTGRLAVSRAFGDIEYKNVGTGKPALVIADPEARFIEKLLPTDEFILLACDGLFDVFTSQEAVNNIRNSLAAQSPDEDQQPVVEALVQEAIESRQSRDNVTAILIMLRPKLTTPD